MLKIRHHIFFSALPAKSQLRRQTSQYPQYLGGIFTSLDGYFYTQLTDQTARFDSDPPEDWVGLSVFPKA